MMLTAQALSHHPFRLTPDVAFHFEGRSQARARAYLNVGLQRREGIQLLTGAVGVGKTALLRSVLDGLDRTRFVPAYLPGTHVDDASWSQCIASAFVLPSHGIPNHEAVGLLEAHLIEHALAGRMGLLVVDEAHALSVRGLEALRLLSNLQLGSEALLQVVLVGQNSLRTRLHEAALQPLAERVSGMAHLDPLSADEIGPYVQHRMAVAGLDTEYEWSPEIFAPLMAATQGNPRRLHVLCERVLLLGQLTEQRTLTAEALALVAEELRREVQVEAEVDSWHTSF